MSQRMTHGTEYLKIFNRIVFSVFIDMMDSQKVGKFIISAFLTLKNHIISHKISSNGGKRWNFCPFLKSKSTISRTIFSIFRGTIKKGFVAFYAKKILSPFIYLRSIITFSRAIFSFICSRRNVLKDFSTYFTVGFNVYFIRIVFTFSGTIFKCFDSVIRNINIFTTLKTFNIRSFHYASR